MRAAGIAVALLAGCTAGLDRATTAVVAGDYPSLQADHIPELNPIDPYAEPVSPVFVGGGVVNRQVGGSIIVDYEIGDPRLAEVMMVRLEVGDYELPSGPNHSVVRDKDGSQVVTIRAKAGAAVTKAERENALAATPWIDSGHHAISATARDAIAGATSDRARVNSLVWWVYLHTSYVIGEEVVASEVLADGQGDCSEMTLLFVAMARSVGIPARRVVGLAGTYEGGEPAFGYHAWAEVEIDGHWVPVDPTWNEEIADATHIKLLEGDGDSWAYAAVALKLSVIDINRAPGAAEIDPREIARELPAHLKLRLP